MRNVEVVLNRIRVEGLCKRAATEAMVCIGQDVGRETLEWYSYVCHKVSLSRLSILNQLWAVSAIFGRFDSIRR